MTSFVDPVPHGRRARKKRATRRALQQAALRLALETDFDQVTVEAICTAADVAPRTFFNHFASKTEVLAGDPPPLPTHQDWQAFAAHTEGELWPDLRDLFEDAARNLALRKDEMRDRRRLMERYPELLPRLRAHFHESEREIVAAIAQRTGAEPDDLYPQLVAGLTLTALRVAVHTWSHAPGDRPVDDYVRDAFALVEKGL